MLKRNILKLPLYSVSSSKALSNGYILSLSKLIAFSLTDVNVTDDCPPPVLYISS